MHRGLSWYGKADKEEDDDSRFIFLWIAFNAIYAKEIGAQTTNKERSVFKAFFGTLLKTDADNRIHGEIWGRFSGPVRILMANRFVFQPFWNHQNGGSGCENWKKWLANSRKDLDKALEAGDTALVLSLIFDRLYTLRNQLIHGGATWGGTVNREQLRDGTEILGFLVPVFIDLMMDNPREDWGKPYYPVVEVST